MRFRKIREFDLSQVQLLDPQFQAGQEAVLSFIRKIDPDRVLCGFRRNAGLPDLGAEPYGGWERALIGGHALGHYFSAAAMAARAFGDRNLKERLENIARELLKCQEAWGSGFLSAASPARPEAPWFQFDIEEGKGKGETWVPWYALHKVLQGLTDLYLYLGIGEGLEAAMGLADWVSDRCGSWDGKIRKRILNTEYGGMNDTLYLLYALTGREDYKNAAAAFDDLPLYRHLTKDPHALSGVHANAAIPKFLGALRRAAVIPGAGDGEEYFARADAFFRRVVRGQMYVTGGVGDMEHFREDYKLDRNRTACNAESCCVYNLLKLSSMLFGMTGDPFYAGYMERALFNARLGSVHPSGGTTYFNPMGTGFFKVFGSGEPEDNLFWCCTGTGMEDFAKLAGNIYYHEDKTLYINQLIASRLDWQEQGIRVLLAGSVKEGDTYTICLEAERDTEIRLRIRIPSWTDEMSFRAEIAGERAKARAEAPAGEGKGFREIALFLHAGEKTSVRIFCPAFLKAESLPDAEDALCFTYGPLVLAAELDTEKKKELTGAGIQVYAPAWKRIRGASVKQDIEYGKSFRGILQEEYLTLPEGMTLEDLKKDPGRLMKRPGKEPVFFLLGCTFRPYNEITDKRYGIYWYFQERI